MFFLKSGVMVEGIILVFAAVTTLYYVLRARRGGKLPEIRPIPAIAGLEEGVGRSVEMNLPVHQEQNLMISGMNAGAMLAGLTIGKYLAKLCARKGANLICHMGYTGETRALIEETMYEAYVEEGKEKSFPKDVVRYHGSKTEVLHASITESLGVEGVGMWFSIYGDTPMSMPLEAAKRQGAIIVGGSYGWGGMSAVYALLADYLMITEDVYASGALLTGNRDMISSLSGEDVIKFFVLAFLTLGIIVSLMGINFSNFIKL
jgi:hypothetical protein